MLKNLKKAAAIVLSFAMAVQFGLADSYYVNAVEEPVEPQQQEETTTTAPQEQEEVPTTEEETPQQQEEEQQQPAVEEEQPAAEEAQPQPVEQAEVKVSYVKEDGTDLMESVTATYDVGYRLDQDTNVFKEAHEAFEFEYAFVNGNKENKITKDQVKASGLTVTSDMTSLTLVYKSTATQKDSKDKKVETANLSGEKEDDSDSDSEEKNISVASDTDTTRTIKVGETITLTSRDVDKYNYYYHNWTVEDGSKVKLNKTNGISITVKGLQEGTTIVTDTYSWGWEQKTKEYTITVNAAVTPTDISISGANTVKQFQTTQLTANLTPADANGKVTWTSSNEQILSVDENGLVTGNRQGSATITASVQGANNKTLSATKTIEVVKNESPSGNNRQQAMVYYLKDPTKDANSNGSDQWGPSSLGTAIVNVEGATWTGGKNCFDNVDQRVVSWPNGTNVISRSNNAWDLIFDAYKASIESQLGVTITKDDVEEISLVPAKISRNNGTNPDMHLDCNVNIKCKSVALVKYYLFDANGTNWEMLGSKNYLVKDESTTQPSDVTNKDFPTTKTVNGVTYTFSGWYTDQSLTTPAPSFPAKVTGSVTYYAKYVAGYQVSYNLAGGKFSDGSTSATEKHNVDTTVVVKNAPTRKGYKFTSWKVEGLDGTTTINSGESFTMPNGNVTLTANWEKKDINDYVTLTTKDVEEKYNGQSHAAGEATAVAKAGKENEIGKLTVEYQKADGKWTTNREEITARDVSDSKTVNVRVSSDDCVGYVTGTERLTITQRAVTMTSKSASKTYDGTALTKHEVTETGEGFVDGEGATYSYTGSQTLVGSSDNAFKYTLNKGTNADNYVITQKYGTLTVTNRSEKEKFEITVKANSVNAPYDGKEHEAAGFETTEFTENEQKYTVSGLTTESPKKTNAGTYTNNISGTAVVKDKDGNDVTAQFTVKTENGNLVINKRAVTMTSKSASKTYDGTALTKHEVTETGEGFVDGEGATYSYTGSQTLVGSSDNAFKYTLNKGTNADNYVITQKYGTLTVTNRSEKEKFEITVKANSVNAPYDGKEHEAAGFETTEFTENEQKYTVSGLTTESPKKTNAGTYTNNISGTAVVKDKDGNDVTAQFTVKTENGNLVINRKKYTVETLDGNKTYDGTPLTAGAKINGIIAGEVVEIKTTKSLTDVGNILNDKYELTWKTAKATNYKLDGEKFGTLKVTVQSIDPGTDPDKPNPDYTGAKINSPSDAVYDGNEHKWIPTVTDKADKKLKAGTDYTVGYSTSDFTNVGTIKVTITGKGNYTGKVTRTYKITPKSVTVTADNKSKLFGETDPKLTATVAGTVGKDKVKYTVAREAGEDVGHYSVIPTGEEIQGNYKVTYVAGTLTITSQSIDPGTDPEKPNPDYTGAKVNSPSDSVYDGNEHKWIPTVTDKADKKLKAGTDYTVEYSTSDFTNVGTIEVVIKGKGNYSGTVKRSYKVTPKEYTVTTDSATKTYSGTALTASGKVEGIVSGETVEFTTTGSQTEVGTSKNTYELVWKSAKATNYTLAKESIGKLTVKAKSIVPDGPDTPDEKKTGITVSEPSDSKYDGKEHREVLTVTDTKTGKELVAGTDYSVTYSSDLVNAGTVKVTVAGLGNYTGSFTKTYKITKRSVTLTSATVSKVYDGSAITNTSIAVSGDGFVEGEGASYEVTGTQTEVGNSANSFEYKLNENTLASNYNITKVVGTLTITAAPAPVTPATPSTPSTPSSTTSTTPRTPSAPQVTTPAETVEKETTHKAEPKKEEKVEEEYTPKASPQYYWALINLICAILTVLFGLLLLISKRHKDEDDDEEDDETKQQTNNDDEENEQEKKRGLFTRVLAVLIAIVSVVFFLVTEDLSLPWTWTDQWTIWMVVIGLVQIVVFFVGRKWKNVDNDDDDEEAQQA